MTEPILYRQTFLIAVMTAIYTVMPPLTALSSLGLVVRHWNISFAYSPASLAVIITLSFLLLIRPPGSLSSQLASRHAQTVAVVLGQWLLMAAVLFILGYLTHTLRLFPG